MSLLPSCNQGAPGVSYDIPNIGTSLAPVVQVNADGTGALRVGNGRTGLVLQTNVATVGSTACTVRAGDVAGSTLNLGSSGNSANNIVLTDNSVQINDQMTFSNGTIFSVNNAIGAQAGANPAVATLDTYTNRDIHGYSDKGYATEAFPVAGNGVIPNPAVVPAGLWSIIYNSSAGSEKVDCSATCYWTGAAWYGSGMSFNTGATAIAPAAGRAQLEMGGSSNLPGTVVFRQLLAAP